MRRYHAYSLMAICATTVSALASGLASHYPELPMSAGQGGGDTVVSVVQEIDSVLLSIPRRHHRATLPDSAAVTLPDSAAVTLPDSAAVAMPDSIATLPDSIAMAALDSVSSAALDSLAALPDSMLAIADEPQRIPRLSTRTINTTPATPATIVRKKADLDNPVDFNAADSMVMHGRSQAVMYGPSEVKYGDINLTANQIEMDMTNSEVYAIGVPDSLGEVEGTPVFTDHGTDYLSQSMRYNFKSGRGFVTDIITQQGEGYLTGGVAKKMDDNSFFTENGKYTTCDNHEDPHFYFQLTKAKVRPGKDVVTGPGYMVLAGVPLPLAVPFGYFPFSEKYASGIIMPSFGDDYNYGFYLSDGGYYFAISDVIDLAVTGQIYTKGTWGVNARSTYSKRYKYSGSFNMNYLTTITGDKGLPDYVKATNFQIQWSHSQDSKANPNMTLSASVNFATSGYSRSEVTNYYSSSFTENTKSSTVNMTYRPAGSKWSFSTTANVSQRTQDSTLTVSFPNVTVTMSQTAPFKRKRAVGAEKWYEKIKLSYSGILNNSLTATQNEFFKKSLIKDWRNGMKHSVPISATFNLFQYLNLTPSVSVTDRMYTTKVRRQWDPNAAAEVCDTTYSLYNVWDFSTALSLDTKIYGFFQPLPFLGDKVKMIRHVFTPTVSFSYSPDFASSFFGYYGSYQYPNSQGEMVTKTYSMFPNSLFGVPGQGMSGTMSVSLANNLEMKVRSDNDSIGEKKISLIENLQLNQSYNFAADSLKLSNLNTSVLLRLTKNFNLNLSAVWDVYTYALNSAGNPVRVNKLRISQGKGYGKLSSTGTSFSYTFNNDTFKKLFGRTKDNSDDKKGDRSDLQDLADDASEIEGPRRNDRGAPDAGKENFNDGMTFNDDGYMQWDVPWSFSVNYSVNYSYGDFNYQKLEYNGKFTQNLSFSGNIRPTKAWNLSFSASYNFDTGKIAYMNCNVSRDMHCFTMSASFVPVGPYKSYNFHIAVKSSLLSDVKYDKRSSASNGVTWY